ncbi:MAG: photosystem II stability/assembly factor-like uncharacterized protein, partial [Planctomycetota bacterium]
MKTLLCLAALVCLRFDAIAQEGQPSVWDAEAFAGLELRGIGPAFMSGRIADVVIHPQDENIWYIGVGSGGVWKTVNAGVTWTPIFDDQGAYSIGCVSIDPSHPETVWVGTGEDVGGRHMGFGDGAYRSVDGGANWTHMGLRDTQHITEILVHPDDPDTVWVAAQGPLWSAGGERGVYKTSDGGGSWKRVLGDDEWTGVASLVMDPRDSQRLYAATWQRHRTVAAYMGGGAGSGLHRSVDGGETWEALSHGLPETHMGKIGLAISPQQPDVVYAAIELDRRTGGIYRSSDRGATWEKRSDTVSGGTGPHYYMELYASPHEFDRIYLADVRMQVSEDGGATFARMPEKSKHSDNHALAFRASDPDYLLAGCDGGLYESFDLAQNWRFMANLPLTQFYKIAVDDAEPFYNVYGGTQDNSTEGGPSRTDNEHGIRNSDWRVVLDWDGHQPATEPGNPNILYAERQEGTLARIDVSTGEVVDVQPQAGRGEGPERFNWDAPILVSPHNPARIYFASQRVWRSENRGDEWAAVSTDLTRNEERFALPIMGQTRSWDNPWDVLAMSNYNTITSLAESPVAEGLLWAGTDDGLIQISEDAGANWRAIEVGSLPGVPGTAFVNDIKADLFDPDSAYVALDNHKYGDFEPYLVKTTDRGRSWHSMRANLPPRTMVWRLVQDHVQPSLFFVATEFGLYFSVNAGEQWTKLTGGVPIISFRDLTIQRREDDLVAASFGRGIYILDDMSVFRCLSDEQLTDAATLFPTRDAWWYFPRPQLGFEAGKGDQGASFFSAPNPPFGAVFTYRLKDDLQTRAARRKADEKRMTEAGEAIAFPGWEALEAERTEPVPEIWLTVRDENGQVVRRVPGPTGKGFHRVAWDLRHPTPNAVPLVEPPPPMWGGPPRGLMAAPGRYQVTLHSQVDGKMHELSEPQSFEVVPMRTGALAGADPAAVASFWREYEAGVRRHSAALLCVARLLTRVGRVQQVLAESRPDDGGLDRRYHALRREIMELDDRLNGDSSRQAAGEKVSATIGERLFAVSRGVERSTYGPTPTHRQSLAIANAELKALQPRIEGQQQRMSLLIQDLL